MNEERLTTDSKQDNGRFVALLEELTSIKDRYVAQEVERYKKIAPMNRSFFLVFSILIILFSVSIPFLVNLEGIWKNIALPIAALAVTGLTGLNSFFHWESNWRGFTQTQVKLQHQLWVWELRIAEAKNEVDEQKAIAISLQVTEQLLEETKLATNSEAEGFFKQIQAPQVSQTHIK